MVDYGFYCASARLLSRASRLFIVWLLTQTSGSAAPIVITEFFNTSLRHYVQITDAAEVAAIEAGAAGPGWQKTGKTLNANSSQSDAPALVPVCRFYGSVTPGPNSHFFTADVDECAAVKTDPGWHYEGIAFYVALPVDGECGVGQVPVWRAYNNGFRPDVGINDGNHRFSVERASVQKLIDSGWNDEGAVFCAQADNPDVPVFLTVPPALLRMLPGSTRTVPIVIDSRNEFTGAISLSTAGVPVGMSAEIVPANVTLGAGRAYARLRLTAPASAAATTSPDVLIVRAMDGAGRSAIAGISVSIAAAGDPGAVKLAAIAAVEEKFRELRGQSPALTPLALIQGIAGYMSARPEYAAAGVDVDTITAWGRFVDGDVHAVVDNLAAPTLTAQSVTAPSDTKARKVAGAELPSATKARVIHAFGSGYFGQRHVDDMRTYLKSKNWTLRGGPSNEAHVGTLMGTKGDGFLYLNTHGGQVDISDPREPSGKMFAVWSSTLVDDDYDKIFRTELADLNLVHMTGDTFRGTNADPIVESHYGITHRFVAKHMSFAGESVVFMNACFGGRDSDFISAFNNAGAGVYLGWSERLSDTAAFPAATYFVDRMLGANKHPTKESPPQRAFPYDQVLSDMHNKGLDTDVANKNGKLGATVKAGLPYPPIFAPSIRYVRVNEFDEELVLKGEFGADKPIVTVGGQQRAVKAWSAFEITTDLPRTGAGSSGDVVVEVRGVKSNARQLTEWTIVLNYNWEAVVNIPEWRMIGQGLLRYRADIAEYRLLPGETPRFAILGGVPTKDSFLTVTAAGQHQDDCITTLDGVGHYASPSAPAADGVLLTGGIKVANESKTGVLGIAFGATMGSPHTITISGGPNCTGVFRLAAYVGHLDGFQNVPVDQSDNPTVIMVSSANLTLDANYGIIGRNFIDNALGGSINVSWPLAPAKSPPRLGDDAGR